MLMLYSTRLASRQMFKRPAAIRQFSLLVPQVPKPEPPAELQNTPLTDQMFRELEASHTAFNEKCAGELQDMNKNIIDNIVDRGGSEGWDATEDYLKKSFSFDSFEEAQAFCQSVRNFCNEKDHHPEWSSADGGCTVNVTLTSHFAGNKVTRLDYELAEALNNSYTITRGGYKQHPRFDDKQWASLKIGVGMFVLGSVIVKIAFDQANNPRPQMSLYERPVEFRLESTIPVQAAIDLKSTSNEDLLHYAYTKLEKKPKAPPL